MKKRKGEDSMYKIKNMIKVWEQKSRFKDLERRIYKLKGEELQIGISILRVVYIDEATNEKKELWQWKNLNDSLEEILETYGA
jgi:hypothetical protein